MRLLAARFKPSDTQLEVEPKETVLSAALRLDYRINWGCDAGACLVCSAKLLAGKVLLKDGEVITPSGEPNEVLLCQSYLLEDSEFEFTDIWPPGDFPVFHLTCQVIAVTPNTNSKPQFTVALRLPAGKRVERSTGQWLKVHYLNPEQTQVFKIEPLAIDESNGSEIENEDPQRLVTFTVSNDDERLRKELERRIIKISLPYSSR